MADKINSSGNSHKHVVLVCRGTGCVAGGSDEIYGAERVIFSELVALQKQGVEVVFLMLQETRLGRKSDKMAQVVINPPTITIVFRLIRSAKIPIGT